MITLKNGFHQTDKLIKTLIKIKKRLNATEVLTQEYNFLNEIHSELKSYHREEVIRNIYRYNDKTLTWIIYGMSVVIIFLIGLIGYLDA